MRKLIILTLGLVTAFLTLPGKSQEKPDFETLLSGNGDIISYIYFKQDGTYFIDSELDASMEIFRYRRFFFAVDFGHEIYMGRKYNSDMVFDPNRGGWAFGLGGRFEFDKYFFDLQMHHDCFHDVGRWEQEDFSVFWNTPRIGVGTIGYLPKYRFHPSSSSEQRLIFPHKLDYLLQAGFFAPRGADIWQKNHDYEFTAVTNFILLIARYKSLGFGIESNNLWVINTNHDLKRRHGLNFDLSLYGKHGTLISYIGWWPYDSQSIRNRDGKTVFGLHFGF